MNYKKQIGIVFVVACMVFIIPAIFEYQNMFLRGECIANQGGDTQHCLGIVAIPDQSQASSLFSIIVMMLLFLLCFLKEAIYLAWRKFALWYLPIVGIILLLSSSNSGGNGFNPGYGFDTESLTFFFSGLFALISLLLIVIKSWKLKT